MAGRRWPANARILRRDWIPAFAGMSGESKFLTGSKTGVSALMPRRHFPEDALDDAQEHLVADQRGFDLGNTESCLCNERREAGEAPRE